MSLDISYPVSIDTFNRALNVWQTTLSSGIDANDLSISLDDNCGTLPDQGIITIDDEVIYYESLVLGGGGSAVLTIPVSGRGVDGTTAAVHGIGSLVKRMVTASDINQLQEALELAEEQAGLYKKLTLTHTAMGSPAAVDSLYVLHNGTGSDPLERTMRIDFEMTRTITGVDDIYAHGTLICVRTSADGDNPQLGDVNVTIDAWQGSTPGADIGVAFSMSSNGATGTSLMYQTSAIANTTGLVFKGRVYKVPE